VDTLWETKDTLKSMNPTADIKMEAGDISDENFVKSLVGTVEDCFGRIDYLVNCAGILGPAVRSSDTPTELFDRINNVNYKGSWLCSRAVLGLMINQEPLPEHPRQRGAVVNIASQLGIVGRPKAGKIFSVLLPTQIYQRSFWTVVLIREQDC
jgi:NAD(P)-dependent dehydrogenase (short-subunit alcohol dehydrogenase family)